jgi:hypothetical protein
MRARPRIYSFPPALVQDWIRGIQPNNGFAIVLNDTTTTLEMTFADKDNDAFFTVVFADTTKAYDLMVTGTFSEDLSSTTNLRLSDGDTRRVYLPVDLSSFDENTILHEAKLVIQVVPGSETESGGLVELYAPEDSVIGSEGILSGTPVGTRFLDEGTVQFSIRNIITQFLADSTKNQGFVIRYLPESNSIRRADFYPSSVPDSLPIMQFTFSTPPTFPDS